MHGTPVFRGTRVPVQTLFDYLEGGDTLEDFLEVERSYKCPHDQHSDDHSRIARPTVSRALAIQALEEAKQLLLARA